MTKSTIREKLGTLRTFESRFFTQIVIAFLTFASLWYWSAYFLHPALPGNNPAYPLGWWGWFDQGKYLLSANAFASLDFAGSKHFYAPLYMALGAVFANAFGTHIYWLIDWACLLFYSWVFLRFASRYIPLTLACLLIAATCYFNKVIFETWVVPWTTTLSSFLLSCLILVVLRLSPASQDGKSFFERLASERHNGVADTRPLEVVWLRFGAIATGLMLSTRPVDTLVAATLFCGSAVAFLRYYAPTLSPSSPARVWFAALRNPRVIKELIVVSCLSAATCSIFVVFNLVTSGSVIGSYSAIASSNGYHIADVGEKFVSLILNGEAVYGESGAGLVQHFPWIVASAIGLIWAFLRGDLVLRAVAAAIVVQYFVYLPYGDLLPTGLWRYLNIHYFKWTIPYLAVFASTFVIAILRVRHLNRVWRIALAATVVTVIGLFSIRPHLDFVGATAQIAQSSDGRDGFRVTPACCLSGLDVVDFSGLKSDFNTTYFGNHAVWVDEKKLVPVRDFRVLQTRLGSRLLFIRPVYGQTVFFSPDPAWARSGSMGPITVASLSFGLESPLSSDTPGIYSPYRLGSKISFASGGAGSAFQSEGWSGQEAWGTWTQGKSASLKMAIDSAELIGAGDITLVVRLGAFLPPSLPEQRLGLQLNGEKVFERILAASDGWQKPRDLQIRIPATALKNVSAGRIQLEFLTPDAVSAETVSSGKDTRVLGIGVESICLAPIASASSGTC